MKTPGISLIVTLAFASYAVAQVSPPPTEEEQSVFLPVIGQYGPNPRVPHFAGGSFRFDGKNFHYRYFTDVANDSRPEVTRGIDGAVRYYPSYIELLFPDGKRIYFVRSRMLNRTILIPWSEHQIWKKEGKLDEDKLLYQEL
jgi:hypothetical protein